MSINFQMVQPSGAHSPAETQLCLPIISGTVLSWWYYPKAETPALMDWFVRLETGVAAMSLTMAQIRKVRALQVFKSKGTDMVPGF